MILSGEAANSEGYIEERKAYIDYTPSLEDFFLKILTKKLHSLYLEYDSYKHTYESYQKTENIQQCTLYSIYKVGVWLWRISK